MAPIRRILVVEDDTPVRRLYRTALSLAGFDVRDVNDGLEALRWIDADPPDLIVLDLDLPLINGLTVHAEIAAHAETRHIPIIIATGSGGPLDHLDVACVLRKPFIADELVATVHRCLRSQGETSRP
jgi:DNA-binding response OmpR family regulator